MKIISSLLALTLASGLLHAEPTALFNGTDLSGWKSDAKGDFPYWTVKDGLLVCQSGPGKKGSHLWTEKEFRDYTLTLDFKYGEGTIDSGVMVRGGGDQIQIGISGSLKRDLTAAPYIPGKGYPVESKAAIEAVKQDDWNTLKIVVKGDTYQTWLNGVEGITYTSKTAKESGKIGLQLHGQRDMNISFRNIMIETAE
ncbi:MAG: 3-keto-disaccharide hydrolase [Verrucomicrobiales bacterium]